MPTTSELERLLAAFDELVYQATLDPVAWPRVLANASELVGASEVSLALRSFRDLSVVDPVAATWNEQASREYLETFRHEDMVSPRLVEVPTGRPFVLPELIELGRFCRSTFFNEWAKPHGVAYFGAIKFAIDPEQVGVLTLHRPSEKRDFTRHELEVLHRLSIPLRFALGQRRLAREIRLARDSIDRVAIGIVHLDELGRVLWCNEKAEEIFAGGDGLSVKNRRLRATRNQDNVELAELIDDALRGYVKPTGQGIFVSRRSLEELPLHVVALPLGREFTASLWGEYVPTALFINDMEEADSRARALRGVLQSLFRLTDIQADIACCLLDGASYDDMVQPGRNKETVKDHVKAVYAKTGAGNRTGLERLARRIVMALRSGRERGGRADT